MGRRLLLFGVLATIAATPVPAVQAQAVPPTPPAWSSALPRTLARPLEIETLGPRRIRIHLTLAEGLKSVYEGESFTVASDDMGLVVKGSNVTTTAEMGETKIQQTWPTFVLRVGSAGQIIVTR